MLEEAYIVFKLPSYARNLRNELKASQKIYFTDNGIRNAVINQFNAVSLRNDTGVLWENLMIAERRKRNETHRTFSNTYFWRTTRQQEIDYLEESDGSLDAWEFKWNPHTKTTPPTTFTKAYPKTTFKIISKENFLEFI